jgi:very-short-patch-repair endonuclease
MAAGLPEPEVNIEISDARGRFIGRADLVYRRWRVIVEYDGDQHRTNTKQFDKDVLRLEGFDHAGWDVVRVVGRAFFADRAACILRVRNALTRAGWPG